ncbi:hypothetical protein D3C71_273620 [compost metagenome]
MEKHNAEHLLRVLAHTASIFSNERLAALSVMPQASALLWSPEPVDLPLSPVALENKLIHPNDHWLSASVLGPMARGHCMVNAEGLSAIGGIRPFPSSDRANNNLDHSCNESGTRVFGSTDGSRSTFEIGFFEDNKAICDELFAAGRKKISVLKYMLKNKSDVAFELLMKKPENLVAPRYIQEAFAWI